jgi:transcriptional regulator with XRE-family HTH domain
VLNCDIVSAHLGHFEQIAAELLRALRGKRSQRAFARRLGYRGNPITDWENGRRFPDAVEALRAAQIVRVDVRRAFAQFQAVPPPIDAKGDVVLGSWLSELRGTTSAILVSANVRISRHSPVRRMRMTA